MSAMTDAQLIEAFENLTLPFEQWTHRAHTKIAYCYLQGNSFEEALKKLRAGIKAFNAHYNVPESPASGYNETTTHAFLHLIASTMHAYREVFPAPDADSFCDTHPQLMTKHALRFFYSPRQRMHRLAKTQFVEPDLAPLPLFRDEQRSPT